MQAVRAIVLQLMFGWDTITGLGVFALLSLAFGEPANVYVLAFAGFCAYLPDLDLIPFMLLRKRLNIMTGHWVFFHHPPVLLPLVAIGSWLGASALYPGHEWFVMALAIVCVTGHFVHDASAHPGGFHLLSPFTSDGHVQFTLHQPWIWMHYRIGPWGIRRESRADMISIYEETARLTNVGNELCGRTEAVTPAQVQAFIACGIPLAALVVMHGYQLPF